MGIDRRLFLKTAAMTSTGVVLSNFLNNDNAQAAKLYDVCYESGTNLKTLKRNLKKIAKELYDLPGFDPKRLAIGKRTDKRTYISFYNFSESKNKIGNVLNSHTKELKNIKYIIPNLTRANRGVVVHRYKGLEAKVLHIKHKKSMKKKTLNKISKKQIKDIYFPKNSYSLNEKIEKEIKKIPKNEKISILVYDHRKNETLYSLNSDEPMQCASIIKPILSLGYYHDVINGKIRHSSRNQNKIKLMIQKSKENKHVGNFLKMYSNGRRNQRDSIKRINKIINENYSKIFKNTSIVEPIPNNGKTYKNMASAADYNRFLKALTNEELPYNQEIENLLNLKKTTRMYSNWNSIPKNVKIYSKTGHTSGCCGEMGIVKPLGTNWKMYPYSMICIINRKPDSSSYRKWISPTKNKVNKIFSTIRSHIKRQNNYLTHV
jgi:beta-lactamase class A